MGKKKGTGQNKNIVDLAMDMQVGKIPFAAYPRPIMVRNSKWINLNGRWDCGVTVPFPLQSRLSGFRGEVPDEYTYYTTFDYFPEWDHRVLLHFGAVDQICTVFIDGHKAGSHEGGYLPFTIDITDELDNSEIHKLEVKIKDTLDVKYPYGKQTKNRGGMWYTPVSGIWQTVWIEEVPLKYIRGLKITPSLTGIDLVINGEDTEYSIEITEPKSDGSGDFTQSKAIKQLTVSANKAHIEIDDAKNWTPENPWLYGIRIRSSSDSVASYFALRTISIRQKDGLKRIFLNDEEIFLHAVLDQGYYPEGIFLPNNEKGYTEDILYMKELGFNTLRKHIKIEPQCFYFDCDRLGMLVMQDMVNNSDYHFLRDTIFPTVGAKYKPDFLYHMNEEHREFFENHMLDTAEYLYNFPCIVYYTIFNEGWGQFCADRMYDTLKAVDSTRIIDSASGWFRQLRSDVESKHVYFHRVAQLWHKRPIIISEFGGYCYREKNHVFNTVGTFGYRIYTDKKELSAGIRELYHRDVLPYMKRGLCGSVYTQLSDVEDEINGLYTYDRKICKVDKDTMKHIAKCIYDGVNNGDRDYYHRMKRGWKI